MATNNSINSNIPVEILKGGSNTTAITNTNGVMYFDGTRLLSTTAGLATQVFTSNGPGSAPTYQAPGGIGNFINLPTTTAINVGTIQINSIQFLHGFGTDNTYLGSGSGNFTLTGNFNTGTGTNTLSALTTGTDNSAFGKDALLGVTQGSRNTGLGQLAGRFITTGSDNLTIGNRAADNLLTGINNICIGNNAGGAYTSNETNNICIGNIGLVADSGVIRIGTPGTHIASVMSGNILGSGKTLTLNIGGAAASGGDVGIQVEESAINIGFVRTSSARTSWEIKTPADAGTCSVFPGVSGGRISFQGLSNTAIGLDALILNTGARNTACGEMALDNNLGGANNTGIGQNSMGANTTGSNNVGLGLNSLSNITTGVFNTAIGRDAGTLLTGADSSNICINNGGVSGDTSTIRIGVSQTRSFITGIVGRTTGINDAITVLIDSAGQLGTVSSSKRFKENIKDMGSSSDDLMNLRPVTFNYKKYGTKSREYGLIAEEVEKFYPELVVHDKDGEVETIKYHLLYGMLLNEIQKNRKLIEENKRLILSITGKDI